MKVLKIGADWCPECLIMKPRWVEVEKELKGLATEYIDYDKNPELKKKYSIDHVPTFIFLDKNDKEIVRLKGIVEKIDLIKIIEANKDK